MKYFVGMDLGTQSSKGVLFAPDGSIAAQATSQYLPDYPKPNWAEQDTGVWIKALKEILGKLIYESRVSSDEIGAIAFASQCGGMVAIDKDCNALCKCILWLDRRSEEQCDVLKTKITEDEAYHLVGAPITSALRALKIMWLKENAPDVYEKAAAFLDCGEYMVAYLTGQIVGDYAHASITGLYDVGAREWSSHMANLTGISTEKMQSIKAASDIAGQIRPSVARELGLSASTQVVVGTGDQHAATIGAGLIGTGNILNIMGTAEIIASASAHAVYDKRKLLRTHLHVDPALWQIEQGALISGAAVRWFRDNVSRVSYDEMNALAEESTIGSNGLLFFSGLSGATSPVVNGRARGSFFGLTLGTKLSDMTRAIYEGCTYGFRDSIESMNEMGLGNGDIIAGGGGIKSAVWMQAKADIVGKRILTLKNSDATPIGAGMLAGVAQKNFSSFDDAAQRLVEYSTAYEPNATNKALYDELYAFYRDIYFTSEPLFEHYRNL